MFYVFNAYSSIYHESNLSIYSLRFALLLFQSLALDIGYILLLAAPSQAIVTNLLLIEYQQISFQPST